ncbi:MAG: TetR/AcrR family transcriptional regulator [Actinomycetota bacterium]
MLIDRAAAVRAALRRLVADRGFHGASMSAVAKEAGVATGTAYVHYPSKDELIRAAYRELKAEFSAAGAAAIDPGAPPAVRFRQLWLGCHAYLAEDPVRARFLIQVDASPYAAALHAEAMAAADDPLVASVAEADVRAALLPLPEEVIYDLAIGPLLRLAAAERPLDVAELTMLADGCWRAVSRPGNEASTG